jgi:hypothetical protein
MFLNYSDLNSHPSRRAAFSDLHYEEQESIASNDKVVSIMIVTGKHTGDFFVILQKVTTSHIKQRIFRELQMTR